MTREGSEPRVSIIVVNWNGSRLLPKCLESLFQQSYSNREVILVDNGSQDGSVRLVRANFPAVKLVELSENKGFAGGSSAGLAVAEGQYIALINNDARADKTWLEKLVLPMNEDPGVGICASKLIIEGTGKINSAGDGITTAGVGFNRGLHAERPLYEFGESVFGACGAAVLYRRDMVDEIGFLDEDFFLYDEDTDLNFRAQLRGWKCIYVPQAVVYHKVNATARRLSDLHVYYHTRNLELVWIKNMPTGLMLRFAHHKLIQEVGSFSYICLRHWKWSPFFRAKRDALKMLPLVLKKRREIQKRKAVPSRYIKKLLTPVFSREMMRQKVLQFLRG